jgi:hypothetical protein
MKSIVGIIFGMVMAVVFSGCSAIDEDLSDCDETLKLDYELHLVTNLSIELQKELDKKTDARLLEALRRYLSPVFSDYAHDLDLSFYDTQGDFARLHHEQHQMDANEMSYTLYIPYRDYMHLATANVDGNGIVTQEGGDHCRTAQFLQSRSDTISTHKTGLFTAREAIRMKKNDDQTIFVRLYMANCAAGLILDTSKATLKDLKVFATGFATSFNIADSSYVYSERPPMIVTDKINTGSDNQQCFCTVNFPSKNPSGPSTRFVTEVEDPRASIDAPDALWELHVYAFLADGTVTKSVIGVKNPLLAAQLKILHARMSSDGSLESDEPGLAVSVTLDWKEAGHHEVPL